MRKRRGFTLIEVLVAMVVAVAAMALLSQGFTTGARASVTAQYSTRAAILAQRVITDLETGYLPSSSNQSGKFDDDPDFSYETKVETPDLLGTSPDGLSKITVTVTWQERNSDQTFELVRLLRTSNKTAATSSSGATTAPSTTPKK